MYRILHTGMTTNYGGVESVVMNWYRHINREKIQFDFLVSHKSPLIAYEYEIKKLGGHVYRSYYGRKEKPFTARKYIEEIFFNDSNIMGVHMNLNTLEYITPLLVAEKKGLPVRIAHSHNTGNLNRKQHLETRIMQSLNKRILQSPKYTKMGCSVYAYEYMFGNKETTVIHNAIETEKFRFNNRRRKLLRERYGISEKTKVIGFIGRLQYQKNPEFLLRVFCEYQKKINPNSILMIIGTGPLEIKCKEIVKNLFLEDRVIFVGMINETSDYYSLFDVFLLPSLFEGLPVVLIEAQTSSLPCLISNNIREDVMITSLVERNKLDDSIRNWALHLDQMVKKFSTIDRNKDTFVKAVSSAGYDIAQEVKILEKMYLSMIEGR